MMGSRPFAAPPSPAEWDDVVRLVRESGDSIAAKLAELAQEKDRCAAALAALSVARAEHDARHAEVDKRSQAADARDSDLKSREDAAAAREVAAANRQAEFDAQAADLATRSTALAERQKLVEDMLKTAQQDVRRAKAALDQEKAKADEEIARKQHEADVAVKAIIANATAEMATRRVAADADTAERKDALLKAEAEFVARQNDARGKAIKLREALRLA